MLWKTVRLSYQSVFMWVSSRSDLMSIFSHIYSLSCFVVASNRVRGITNELGVNTISIIVVYVLGNRRVGRHKNTVELKNLHQSGTSTSSKAKTKICGLRHIERLGQSRIARPLSPPCLDQPFGPDAEKPEGEEARWLCIKLINLFADPRRSTGWRPGGRFVLDPSPAFCFFLRSLAADVFDGSAYYLGT
jgi:hypothetical protein